MASDKHPTVDLVFFVTEPIGSEVAARMEQFVETLRERQWTLSAPEFVYEEDAEAGTQEDDEPIVTCGGVLGLYSIVGDDLHTLSYEVASGQLADVEYLIGRLEELSLRSHYEIELEYDGVWVGQIEGGKSSASLHAGLTGEWRKALAAMHSN